MVFRVTLDKALDVKHQGNEDVLPHILSVTKITCPAVYVLENSSGEPLEDLLINLTFYFSQLYHFFRRYVTHKKSCRPMQTGSSIIAWADAVQTPCKNQYTHVYTAQSSRKEARPI